MSLSIQRLNRIVWLMWQLIYDKLVYKESDGRHWNSSDQRRRHPSEKPTYSSLSINAVCRLSPAKVAWSSLNARFDDVQRIATKPIPDATGGSRHQELGVGHRLAFLGKDLFKCFIRDVVGSAPRNLSNNLTVNAVSWISKVDYSRCTVQSTQAL
jgi:hypothetical protein